MARREAQPIDDLVRDACCGRVQPLEELLLRRGGLPGPRPNTKLALAAAQALIAKGEAGRQRLEAMLALDERAAPAGSAYPILPMVGVLGLGCIASSATNADERRLGFDRLQQHSDDSRREIRDAVVVAIGLALNERPTEALRWLQSWSDGYFHAELMLRAMADASVLHKLDEVELPLSRLQEAFALAANAPRAHQRSQGYRSLLKTLSRTIVELGKRFPQAVTQWVEQSAAVSTKDLLAALGEALEGMRRAGLRSGDAEAALKALDAAVPAPRDPRSDVGPTRERGRKARRKGRRS